MDVYNGSTIGSPHTDLLLIFYLLLIKFDLTVKLLLHLPFCLELWFNETNKTHNTDFLCKACVCTISSEILFTSPGLVRAGKSVISWVLLSLMITAFRWEKLTQSYLTHNTKKDMKKFSQVCNSKRKLWHNNYY